MSHTCGPRCPSPCCLIRDRRLYCRLSKATGMDAPDTGRLSHIYQLSGFADPVYAEACVTVHDYDIVLEVGPFDVFRPFALRLDKYDYDKDVTL